MSEPAKVIYAAEETALLVEISNAGSMRWDFYTQRCATLGISERRHFDLGVIKFAEKHMEPREHEGRGCVTEPEVAADSLVCLTAKGNEIVAVVGWLNDGLRPVLPKSHRRRFEPLKVVPQRNMFPPVD
ncbi:MAG: hypothetical protein RLY47_475 [Candidatus Parcubacteria bacterium]|jgi:hypothetical protein